MPSKTAPITVLVIDDDRVVRLFVDLVLTQAGYKVLTESSGELGVAAFKRARWDLVLLDIQMPGMNGFEVLRLLRAYMQSKTPVAMMTSTANSETVRRALVAGVDGYLIKPFSPESLVRRVGLAFKTTPPGLPRTSLSFGDLVIR